MCFLCTVNARRKGKRLMSRNYTTKPEAEFPVFPKVRVQQNTENLFIPATLHDAVNG